MPTPDGDSGCGSVNRLAFAATIDDPDRFRRSRDVGAYLGLVPRSWSILLWPRVIMRRQIVFRQGAPHALPPVRYVLCSTWGARALAGAVRLRKCTSAQASPFEGTPG